MSHKCNVGPCTTQIGEDKLMCATHWRLVPAQVQREINKQWRTIRSGKTTQARLDAVNAYRGAVAKANESLDKMGPLL
jgi:hypothetical protein